MGINTRPFALSVSLLVYNRIFDLKSGEEVGMVQLDTATPGAIYSQGMDRH
jgi:hypothetical protein